MRAGKSVTVVLAVLLLCAPASGRDLTVVGFGGGYQESARKHLFETFEEETGIGVSDDTYNGEMAKLYGMVEARNVTYDIVMLEAPEMVRACDDGILAPIDYDVVDAGKFIDGSTHRCGVGATGWGVALFYDASRHAEGPKSFADFWDTTRFPGKRSLRAGPKMTLEIALMADGVPSGEVYEVLSTPQGIQRAFGKLDEIRSHIVWWTTGAQPVQLVGSGEVDYAFGYTNRVLAADAGYALDWSTLLYSLDYWAVLAGSPLQDEAMAMVDWITNAELLRAQAQDWPISPANKAINHDPALRAANPGMILNHSAEGLWIDTEFWLANGDDLEMRFTAWAAR